MSLATSPDDQHHRLEKGRVLEVVWYAKQPHKFVLMQPLDGFASF